jgi:hypothetical protein
MSKAARQSRAIAALLAILLSHDVRAESAFYSCDITRLIVATGKTSSTRRLMLQIELDDNNGHLKFDDESRWGPTQIDVLKPDRIQGSNGPLQFSLDRRSGQLSRYLGGGGRWLLDTGFCVLEKG